MTSFSIRLYRLYTQFNINFAFRLRKKSAGQQHLRCSPGTYIINFLYDSFGIHIPSTLLRLQFLIDTHTTVSPEHCISPEHVVLEQHHKT